MEATSEWPLLGYMTKTCLHTHKAALRDNGRRGTPNNTLSSCSQAHHKSHQPAKGSPPPAQGAVGTRKEQASLPGPFHSCPNAA